MPKRPYDSCGELSKSSFMSFEDEQHQMNKRQPNATSNSISSSGQIVESEPMTLTSLNHNGTDLLRLVGQSKVGASLAYPQHARANHVYINLPEQDAYNQSDQVTIFNIANNTDNSGNGSTCIDPPAAPLRQDQKKELLNLFELILDSQSNEDVPDAVRQRQTSTTRCRGSSTSLRRSNDDIIQKIRKMKLCS